MGWLIVTLTVYTDCSAASDEAQSCVQEQVQPAARARAAAHSSWPKMCLTCALRDNSFVQRLLKSHGHAGC